jgi:predicted molibdopterin-dependent oxidoreductase YjgC
MISIKINNIEVNVPEDITVLKAARNAGINIPTLCHRDGLDHYSSCMVCMVRDRKTNRFIPSCSSLVTGGMDIDTEGDEVLALRKKAVELLLSEHRAECEAPCKVVCPAGYNVPGMNRLLAGGRIKEAIEMSVEQTRQEELQCINCAAYCENACRRKKVDLPVSIRNLQIFVYDQVAGSRHTTVVNRDGKTGISLRRSDHSDKKKRFMSRIGRLDDSELTEWIKECSEKISRSKEITDIGSASGEANSCMHCDCRAADDCRLRDLAEEYSIKDPRGKLVNSPAIKKINRTTGLIFENAKCIKCGLCVRVCEKYTDEPSLCFINRGFVSIISEPLTEEFDDILLSRSSEVIDICPTGALSHKDD